MTAFFRFPHTPHLAWLGGDPPRGDKVLSLQQARDLLSHPVTVEEKVDGANLGFSVDEFGELRAQNRGEYLVLDELPGQFRPLRRWLATRRAALVAALPPNLILFGEWCYAVHSISYTRLPDWFLAFDVYDREEGQFWCTKRRDELVARLGLAAVPTLARGRFTVAALRGLFGPSRLSDEAAEGLVLRRDDDRHLLARAKMVRPQFAQQISEHWAAGPMKVNQLGVAP
jgi:ATP-dependent RNA circularization protein (DNA/RNA ligase family)